MTDYNVLIVDDDRNIIDSIKRLSMRENFNVSGACSAEEALQMLNSGLFDLIVTDENMPGMKGSDFILKVRDLFPGIIRIMLTGHANLELAVKLINQGDIYRFFTKPCNSYDLLLSIRQAIQYRTLLQKSYVLLQIARHQSEIISTFREKNKIDKDKIFLIDSFKKNEMHKIEIDSLIKEIDSLNINFTVNNR